MAKVLSILVVALFLEATGVVLLKQGIGEIGSAANWTPGEIARLIGRGILNKRILLGVLFEAAFFGALLYLLSKHNVSLIWPLTSLSFVVTALFAKFYLHEEVTPLRWGGVGLILLGAFLISWSEKAIERNKAAAAAATTLQSH